MTCKAQWPSEAALVAAYRTGYAEYSEIYGRGGVSGQMKPCKASSAYTTFQITTAPARARGLLRWSRGY